MPEWYSKLRFGDLPARAAGRFGDREGLVVEDRRYTFRDIDREVDTAARALMHLGVGKGDHVSIWLNNREEWMFIQLGLSRIGAVFVPLNTRLRTSEIGYVVGQSDSAMLITHDRSGPVDYLAMVKEVFALPGDGQVIEDGNFPRLRRVVIVGDQAAAGTVSWEEAKKNAHLVSDAELETRAGQVDPDDLALIMYTSGTTGFPKGVMHCHNLIKNIHDRLYKCNITVNDTILNYLPLYHVYGFSEGVIASLISGARQIMCPVFDPDKCLDIVEQEGVSVLHGFDTHVKMLVEAQEARPRNLSSLRTGSFAAGPRNAEPIIRKAAEVLHPFVSVTGYGMTETWAGVCYSSLDDDVDRRATTSGYPGHGFDVRLVDAETGAIVTEPYRDGLMEVRGTSIMMGYYRKPVETAEAFTKDGWLRTQDLGHWHLDGYMRFLGRARDVLKVGGETVDPLEVEGFLRLHPAIHEISVVGAYDPRLDEVAVAYVKCWPGSEISLEEVEAHCRRKLASFKIPRHLVFIDEFPMTASGKIQKAKLREDAETRFGKRAS